ncbi:Proteasome subunit beta type-7 [Gracilariopsis chorda]|uniref:Proteasome subunit beta n=1 Tax=Gracilariopsis chorda TaxID=448386 RepID=A0A2V3ITF7_9FLOR|nr:Proteasome subunit beta type-7 [Gracilariopsis chorda]|eukprot:PXF45394.1 Proteasome subunit beta type-7 [Gracilariopsis chorda]
MNTPESARGGFCFENAIRNSVLSANGYKAPTARKTGTTIAGVVFEGGVVLGADTRATSGATVFEKNCQKIHYIADNIMCCGAGTAADTEHTTQLIASKIWLHALATRRKPRVATALSMLKHMLFRYQGYVSAALVLGGVDFHGPHLYTVYPHGSTDRLPYVSMGSGSLAAMAVFEANYKDGLTLEDAKQLVYEGISGGIFNDLGSGGNVDLCIITADGQELIRGYAKENERKYRRPGGYKFPSGTTPVVPGSEKFKEQSKDFALVTEQDGMDVSA